MPGELAGRRQSQGTQPGKARQAHLRPRGSCHVQYLSFHVLLSLSATRCSSQNNSWTEEAGGAHTPHAIAQRHAKELLAVLHTSPQLRAQIHHQKALPHLQQGSPATNRRKLPTNSSPDPAFPAWFLTASNGNQHGSFHLSGCTHANKFPLKTKR